MKYKTLTRVIISIIIVVVCGGIWWISPDVWLKSVESKDVSHIDVFNVNTGCCFMIEDKEDIDFIISNIQSIRFKKKGISISDDVAMFKLNVYHIDGWMIQSFCIDSKSIMRKKPFIYKDDLSSLCIDYLKGLEEKLKNTQT